MTCYAVIDTNVLVLARQMLDILDGKVDWLILRK